MAKNVDTSTTESPANTLPEYVQLTEGFNGAPYLPEVAPTVPRKLWEGVKHYETVKSARVELSAEETKAKKELEAVAEVYKSEFLPVDPDDPDNHNLVWKAGGLQCIIEVTESNKIKTSVDKDAGSGTTETEEPKKKGRGKSAGADNQELLNDY